MNVRSIRVSTECIANNNISGGFIRVIGPHHVQKVRIQQRTRDPNGSNNQRNRRDCAEPTHPFHIYHHLALPGNRSQLKLQGACTFPID